MGQIRVAPRTALVIVVVAMRDMVTQHDIFIGLDWHGLSRQFATVADLVARVTTALRTGRPTVDVTTVYQTCTAMGACMGHTLDIHTMKQIKRTYEECARAEGVGPMRVSFLDALVVATEGLKDMSGINSHAFKERDPTLKWHARIVEKLFTNFVSAIDKGVLWEADGAVDAAEFFGSCTLRGLSQERGGGGMAAVR